jgi:hypothetical protein
MAVALSSSRADCAGLQSTLTTLRAPCRHRLRLLQPPLVSVSTVSSALIFSTCAADHHEAEYSVIVVRATSNAPPLTQLPQPQPCMLLLPPYDHSHCGSFISHLSVKHAAPVQMPETTCPEGRGFG